MASSCYPFDDNASEISVASSIGSTGSEEYSLQSHSIYETCCERSLNHHSLGTYCDFNLAKKVTCVALDCEFVGVGPSGKQSALGRCSIVDYEGRLICDIFATPDEPVTDYRTRWSGLRKGHKIHAIPISSAKRLIRKLLKNKVIIGHSLHNDFSVLDFHAPSSHVRDLAKCEFLRKMVWPEVKNVIGLKRLSKLLLGRNIQVSEHCSIEDARATMELYHLVEKQWEKNLKSHLFLQSANNVLPKQRTSSESYFNDEYWPDDLKQ